MAFLRIDKKSSGQYLRIVESYRDERGRVLQRTLHHLGKVEDYSPEMLKRIGEKLYELGGGDLRDLVGEDIEEVGRYNYGFYFVYRKIFRQYGLDRILSRIARRKKLRFNLSDAVMLMLIQRLNLPTSKRENFHLQNEYLGPDEVQIQHLYRSLDHLAENQQLVQNCIYQSGRDLFNQKLDVVFYDVTTFYFDSDKIIEGSLRQKGFSKDGKVGKTQILFGLLIDRFKQPIGYRIYRGDTFEGHTFEQALDSLRDHYNIDKVIVVADRGMLSKANLKLTTGRGYEFIVGERLKQLPQKVQEGLLDKTRYGKEWVMHPNTEDPVVVRYHVTEYEGRTIIGTYNPKRAKKDQAEREGRIEKAKALLENPSRLKAKARRFIINTEQGKVELNEERIKKAERYDGLLAISTNATKLEVDQVLEHYRNLYQIEHSFRTFKTHLETRPMFHWTDKRIEGHICLCYIAYTLLNRLQLTLQKKGVNFSEKTIRKTLERMQMSLIKQGKKEFYLRSKVTEEAATLLNKVGKKPPPALFPKSQITNYLQ